MTPRVSSKLGAIPRERRRTLHLLIALLAAAQPLAAHVGSPDVFLDAHAGPYRLFVTVRPPHAIPGIADVEILTTSDEVREVRIVPLPLTGPGATFAPTPDVASRSRDDPRLFTGHLWLMSAGTWQIRVSATGRAGSGAVAVPVPTLPQTTLAMSGSLRAMLFALMVVLCAGFVSIAAAIGREARLEPGEAPGPAARRRGRIAGVVIAAVVLTVLVFGNRWWNAEASSYSRYVYKPLQMTPTLAADGRLRLDIRDPGWLRSRRVDDFIPDHDHLMHLFIVSESLDRFWHVHPQEAIAGTFEHTLSDVPAGRYQMFADVVHATGVAETITAPLDAPAIPPRPLDGDDSAWSEGLGTAHDSTTHDTRIVWVRGSEPLVAKRLTMFMFQVEDADGQPATDLELYMGMPGHAVFVRRDLKVFAHVHPAGSASMAAMELGQRSLEPTEGRHASAPHMHDAASQSVVTFPYGFPEPGEYRIFVQIKRAGRVETAAFDATVR